MIATRTVGRQRSESSPIVDLPDASAQTVRVAGWSAAGLAVMSSAMTWVVSVGSAETAMTQRLTTGLFCIAIVQLAMSRMIPRTGGATAVWLLSVGTVAYGAGILLASVSFATWLMSAGTLAMLSGITLIWRVPVTDWGGRERRILGGLLFAGVALDGALVFATLTPESAWALHMGPPDGLRFRFLALARSAAITLPALALLYQQAARRRVLSAPAICWFCLALHAGAFLMPSVLVLAAFVDPSWKYLLPVPALLVFLGVCGAARLSYRRGRGWEHLGWVLMATSMAIGLAMGLYAFDGPLPSPGWVGAYGDSVRSFIRQTHGLAIVGGILLVFLARDRRSQFQGDHS